MNKKQEQDTPVWDGVEETRLSCCACFTIPAAIIPFVRNEELNKFADSAKVHEKLTILDRDVAAFKDKLNAISARHAGKTGPAANADDHMKALEIAEAYINWSSSYEALILPTMEDITDLYVAAEKKMAEAAQSPDTGDVEAALADELATNSAEPGNHVDSVNDVILPPTAQDSSTND